MIDIEPMKSIMEEQRDLLQQIALGLAQPREGLDLPVNSVNLQNLQVDRPSRKMQQALDWLTVHPGHLDTPSRDLVDEIGVSHMTIYKAQQILKEVENG